MDGMWLGRLAPLHFWSGVGIGLASLHLLFHLLSLLFEIKRREAWGKKRRMRLRKTKEEREVSKFHYFHVDTLFSSQYGCLYSFTTYIYFPLSSSPSNLPIEAHSVTNAVYFFTSPSTQRRGVAFNFHKSDDDGDDVRFPSAERKMKG